MVKAHGRGSAPSDNAPFLLLEVPESSARKGRILGSVIPERNASIPFQHYRPNLNDKNLSEADNKKLNDVLGDLWHEEETVELTDIITGKTGAKSADVRAKVTDLFKAYGRRATREDVRITAGKAKRYTFDNPGSNLQDILLDCGPWKEQLQKLYDELPTKDKTSLLLVTGVFTCSDIEVSWNKVAGDGAGGAAKIPAAELAGWPEPNTARKFDLGFEFDIGKSTSTEAFAECKEEVIFALSYSDLILEFDDAPNVAQPVRWLKYILAKKRGARTKISGAHVGEIRRGKGIDPFAAADGEDTGDGDLFYHETPRYVTLEHTRTNQQSLAPHVNGSA